MKALDPKNPESFKRIQEIIEKITPSWKGQPNIIDIVPALKTSAGHVQPDKLVIGFHVTEKTRTDLLEDRGYTPIPPEIEGIPTDVILARRRALGSVDTKSTRSQMFDTLIGGIAVGNAEMNAYGTLGMTLLAESDGRQVAITNEHVLVYDGDGQVGDEVQQPRFHLTSEVSLDAATCCPDGELHYRGVDNPIVDAAVATFVAAAVAAACSDEIDPHRRGQAATVPEPGERTLQENVSVSLRFPEIPFPGRPYKVIIKWDYQRKTDRRIIEYSISEEKQNEHCVDYRHLITDKQEYPRGGKVTLLAMLGSSTDDLACPDFFVTAAALSPSCNKAYKVILRPYRIPVGQVPSLTHGETAHVIENDMVRRCYNFDGQKPGDYFRTPRTIDGNTYDPEEYTARFIQSDPSDPVALRFPHHGMVIRLREPADRVTAYIRANQKMPVTLTAYSGTAKVDSAVSSKTGVVPVVVSAPGIDHVRLEGGGGDYSLLVRLCVESQPAGKKCLYTGTIQLAPGDEPGTWKTFLFAQTRNTVAAGTDPAIAAQTIGGLPVTDNFTDLGKSYNITYGNRCNVGIVSDGEFIVV